MFFDFGINNLSLLILAWQCVRWRGLRLVKPQKIFKRSVLKERGKIHPTQKP